MVIPTDRETTAIEKIVCNLEFPRGGAPGATREGPEWVRRQRGWELCLRACRGFRGKEQEKQGEHV